MSYLERLQAKAAMNASEEPSKGSKVAFAPFAGAPTGHISELPDDVAAGLGRLAKLSAPRLLTPARWPGLVSDALRLANDGWAAKAIALGWSPLDLFGAVTDAAGDPYSDGLAVWLAGRKLLAISATCATAEDVSGRAYFDRRDQDCAELLWDLGHLRPQAQESLIGPSK